MSISPIVRIEALLVEIRDILKQKEEIKNKHKRLILELKLANVENNIRRLESIIEKCNSELGETKNEKE